MRIAPGSIGNMIRSCRAGWLNSDLIARSSPISATPRAALKLVLRHGDGFTATADAASASRPRDLRPGAVGTRARMVELAEALGVGPRHLLRLFMRHAGASPSEIAATRRVQEAKRLIDQTNMTQAEIAFAAGFGSIRRFNDAFAATYKRPPSSFRRPR